MQGDGSARRRLGWTWVSPALLLLAASWTQAREPDLVSLARVDPSIGIDLRYAGPDNFVGRAVDGYEEAVCLLTPAAAAALSSVQGRLRPYGLGLQVFDCYRPQRAVDDFVRWSETAEDPATRSRHHPRIPKSDLFELGYIARASSHSRGSTVDLTLVRLESGSEVPLDMGTPFDYFDAQAHTESPDVPAGARANRLLLVLAMEDGGFRNYEKEWWHYTLADEPYLDRGFDVPVRAARSPEPAGGSR